MNLNFRFINSFFLNHYQASQFFYFYLLFVVNSNLILPYFFLLSIILIIYFLILYDLVNSKIINELNLLDYFYFFNHQALILKNKFIIPKIKSF